MKSPSINNLACFLWRTCREKSSDEILIVKTGKSGRGEINGNPVEAMDEFIIVPHAGINITGIGLIFNEFSATVVLITTLCR